jgi:beta-lactam-binding protein with PASTA domain
MKFKIDTNTLGGLLFNVCLILVLLCILSFVMFYQVLPAITNKGKVVTVPNLKGKSIDEAMQLVAVKDLSIEVTDSSYDGNVDPLTVLEQFPEPNAQVKIKRKINLKLNAKIPPSITFPNLVGSTLGFAQNQLKSLDLKTGSINFRPDMADNTILEVSVDEKKISPGQRIPKGSTIDLLVGIAKEPFALIDFENMSIENAEGHIFNMGLNLKQIHYVESEKEDGVVDKQFPNAGDSVRRGAQVELWVVRKEKQL